MVSDASINSMRDVGFRERGQPVVYRASTTQTVNHLTGAITQAFDDYPCVALVSPEIRGGAASGWFRIRTPDLPHSPPGQADVILWRDKEYHVRGWELSQTGYVHEIRVQRP